MGKYSDHGRPAKGWPEQEPVRAAFREYLKQFKSQVEASRKIGIPPSQVSDWKTGQDRIPDWFCEYLGYRLSYQYVGKVGIQTTEKSA